MLAYLDALIAALSIRDTAEVDRLLAHPLARILPDEAREEARAFCAGRSDPLAAPLRVMRLRHQTAELLREVPDAPVVADRVEPGDRSSSDPSHPGRLRAPTLERRSSRLVQMELPLSA